MPKVAPQRLRPLTARQKVALQMTLDGYSKAEIQERLGISQPTLWRWRTLPAWNEQIDVVLRDEFTDVQGQIRSMLPMATRRLRQLILSPAETVALGACRTALEAHANLVSRDEERLVLTELERGLEELRQAARQQLAPATADAIEAEIVTDAHTTAHAEPHQQELAQCQPAVLPVSPAVLKAAGSGPESSPPICLPPPSPRPSPASTAAATLRSTA